MELLIEFFEGFVLWLGGCIKRVKEGRIDRFFWYIYKSRCIKEEIDEYMCLWKLIFEGNGVW